MFNGTRGFWRAPKCRVGRQSVALSLGKAVFLSTLGGEAFSSFVFFEKYAVIVLTSRYFTCGALKNGEISLVER
jgi:hypothetical protein